MTHSVIRIHWIVAVAFVLVFRSDGIGQNLRVDVVLQQVITTVRDSDDRLVPNLKPEDFIVEFMGVRQPIAHFTQDLNVPISVGLVIDASQSMEAALVAAQRAARTFIRGMRVKDESFLMTFDGVSKVRQDFTNDPSRLFTALRTVQIGAGTSLIESVRNGVDKLRQGKNSKRALIVISDGGDSFARNLDVLSFHNRLRGMETLIYSIQLQDAVHAARLASQVEIAQTQSCNSLSTDLMSCLDRILRGDRDSSGAAENSTPPTTGLQQVRNTAAYTPRLAQRLMEGMAAETGARYFYLDSNVPPEKLSQQLSHTFDEIFSELRGQYTIGFYPPPASDTTRVRVQAVNKSYRVRTVRTKMADMSNLSDDPYETSLQLGQDHERQGRLAAAIQAYEHASTLKPWDAWAFRALGKLYAQEKQFQKAADAFNRLDALNTLSGAERFLFGAILFELNDNARTIEQCDQAIRLIPGNPQPYLLMYSAYIKENKPREALDILEKYLKLFPHDSNRELAVKRIEQLRSTLRNPPK